MLFICGVDVVKLGENVDVWGTEIVDDVAGLIRRDESDLNRKIAPLKKADDAILIDTSNLSKNIVINMILSRL